MGTALLDGDALGLARGKQVLLAEKALQACGSDTVRQRAIQIIARRLLTFLICK